MSIVCCKLVMCMMEPKGETMLLVKQAVKEALKGMGDYQVAQDLYPAMSMSVEKEIMEAVGRAGANKRKTVSARDVTADSFKEMPLLVVQSKVREAVKSMGDYNVAKDFFPALNLRTHMMLKDVARRAKDNGRKTCQARDV